MKWEVLMGGVCTIEGREGPECTDNFQILHQPFEFFGNRFYSAEQAYQASKFSPDSPVFQAILNASPVGKSDEEFGLQVWHRGNSASARSDWHSIKVKTMYLANLCKFAQNRLLAAELMATQGELEAAPSTWRWQFFNTQIMNRIRELLRSGVKLQDEINRVETMDGMAVQGELEAIPDRSNSGNDDGTSSEIQKSTASGDQTVQPGTSVSAGSAGSSGLGPDEPIVCGVSSAGPDSGVGSAGPQDPSGGPA